MVPFNVIINEGDDYTMYWSVNVGQMVYDEPPCFVHHNGVTLLGLPVNQTTCIMHVINATDDSSGIYVSMTRGTMGEVPSGIVNLTVVINHDGN